MYHLVAQSHYRLNYIKILCVFCFAEEFVAHKANVNCLAMGHKSNQVLATGGDDKKVNLWAIGRQSCLMVCVYLLWDIFIFCWLLTLF